MSELLPIDSWTPEDTRDWLAADGNALPPDFLWPHRDRKPDGSPHLARVLPSYRLAKGYGFWLQTTPYFPGLFEEIHRLLLVTDPLPVDGSALATLLNERTKIRGNTDKNC